MKRENSESDLHTNGQVPYQNDHESYDQNQNGYYPQFNQKYQPGYNGENDDSGMMNGQEINQANAFQQTYEDLLPKLRNDIDGLIFVDNYMFPNGSMYKGQMLIDKTTGTEERCGYGIQKWVDGAVYEGNWLENKAEGKGTFWHAEGDIYVGEFKAD